MIYIGIDPGAKGGYAMIITTGDGKTYGFTTHPWDDAEFVKWLRAVRDSKPDRIVAALEKVGAMPHQGVTSMFAFGRSYGFIQGVLTAFDVGYQLVPPAVWKREYGLLHSDKQGSIDVCKRLFPGVNLLPTDKCRKESDGLAESLLLACYAQRHF